MPLPPPTHTLNNFAITVSNDFSRSFTLLRLCIYFIFCISPPVFFFAIFFFFNSSYSSPTTRWTLWRSTCQMECANERERKDGRKQRWKKKIKGNNCNTWKWNLFFPLSTCIFPAMSARHYYLLPYILYFFFFFFLIVNTDTTTKSASKISLNCRRNIKHYVQYLTLIRHRDDSDSPSVTYQTPSS